MKGVASAISVLSEPTSFIPKSSTKINITFGAVSSSSCTAASLFSPPPPPPPPPPDDDDGDAGEVEDDDDNLSDLSDVPYQSDDDGLNYDWELVGGPTGLASSKVRQRVASSEPEHHVAIRVLHTWQQVLHFAYCILHTAYQIPGFAYCLLALPSCDIVP